MKAVQAFTVEYLDRCRWLTPDEIDQFFEDFRQLHSDARVRSKLISIKI